jgi:hypothetical protein
MIPLKEMETAYLRNLPESDRATVLRDLPQIGLKISNFLGSTPVFS